IETPALSQRADDIPLLISELLKRQEKVSQAKVKFTEHAMQSMQLHAWPGNVRELANLLERMVIMYPDQVVDVAELPLKYRHLDVESYMPQYPEGLQERDLINELFQSTDDDSDTDTDVARVFDMDAPQHLPEQGLDLKEYLAELEIRFISQALERHEFVVARAAEVLGLRRTTLVEKMRKYNLGKDE
ncbi:helix-turn-helix domain-containing protein, partial [Rheinheimera baltica]